ncbi:DUF4352 domain-containing protein [Arthrobacter sp. TmT3-37]
MNNRHLTHGRARSLPWRAASASLLVAVIVFTAGCSDAAGTSGTAVKSAGPKASASPADPKPGPDPGESGGPAGGPAFEPASAGAPEVSRGGGAATRGAEVDPVSFAEEAAWDDGLEATTGGFSRGTITATGAGAIAGAAYVTIEVELRNGSADAVDLNTVVATLMTGEEPVPAAPTYDVDGVSDLFGTLAPGETRTGTYAFQVGADTTTGTFYLDVDDEHAVATFDGAFQ